MLAILKMLIKTDKFYWGFKELGLCGFLFDGKPQEHSANFSNQLVACFDHNKHMSFLFFASLSESTKKRKILSKREYLLICEVQKQGPFPQQFEIVKTGKDEQLSFNVARLQRRS